MTEFKPANRYAHKNCKKNTGSLNSRVFIDVKDQEEALFAGRVQYVLAKA